MAFRKIQASNVNTLITEIEDTLILLNSSNLTNVDIGFIGKYGSSAYSGLVKDNTDGHYYLFDNYSGTVTNTDINISDPSVQLSNIHVGNLYTTTLTASTGDISIASAINLGANRIKNVGAPLLSTDATTKTYVDSLVSSTATTTLSSANSYTDSVISGLVDTAPAALDTLNELAAALGDDPNFATTVTNSIATKANTADLSTVATTGSYNDLTDKPTNVSTFTNDLGYITSTISQHIVPDTDITYDLGSATYRFRDLYLSGNTIHIGNSRISAETDGTVAIRDANNALKPVRTSTIELDDVNEDATYSTKIRKVNGKIKFLRVNRSTGVETTDVEPVDLASNSTDNLSEGSNLYYTDSRVSTYLETSGTFKVVQSNTATKAAVNVFSFSGNTYSGAKILASVDNGTNVMTAELLVATNGTTATISVYGITNTGTTPLTTFDVNMIGSNVSVTSAAASATSTTIKLAATMI